MIVPTGRTPGGGHREGLTTSRPASSGTGRGRRSVALIVVAGLALTLVASLWSANAVRAEADARLGTAARDAANRINDQVRTYSVYLTQLRNTALLRGMPTRAEFEDAVGLATEQRMLRGVQAVEWAPAIAAPRLGAFVGSVRGDRSVRVEGYPQFDTHPKAATPIGTHYPIDYLVPYLSNVDAHGFDLGVVEDRRLEIEHARDTGGLVATPPIRLVQEEDDQVGFVLMAPMYRSDTIPLSLAARRSAFAGTLRIVFRTGDLLGRVLAPLEEIDVAVHDLGKARGAIADPTAENVLFATSSRVDHVGETRFVDLEIADRRWRVFVDPTALFQGASGFLPSAVALFGLLVTALSARVAAQQLSARDRALALADAMTTDLRRAQDHLSTLIDHAPDATLVVARDGTITKASRRVRELFGYGPDEVVGSPIERLLPEAVREAHRSHRASFLHDPHPREMGSGQPLLARRADGTEFPVEVSLAPVDQRDGLAVIAAVRDVSIRRQAEALLREALDHERAAADRLRETDRLRGAFLETVSHELRTPLSAIVGFTELIRRRRSDLTDEQVHDFIERIDRNAKGLHRLIAELLDFSRIERDALEAHIEAVDLDALVRDLVASLDTVLETHRIELDVDRHVVAAADPNLLERAVSNLLTNAARYAPEGTTITVRVEAHGERATVSVHDEGPGIPADERNLVFERFYRGHAARQRSIPGTGIGLAVVRDVIELMGGSVEVAASGPGATIVVSLTRLSSTAVASTRRSYGVDVGTDASPA